jgi:hypothetical protein
VELINDIVWEKREKRLPKVLYVLSKTRRPEILRAAIDKLNLLDPQEFMPADDLLSSKSSHSGEKNTEIQKARELLVLKMIAENKEFLKTTEDLCEGMGKFQQSLAFILGKNVPDRLFQAALAERNFPNLEVFKKFYLSLLGNKIYPPDLAEKRRKYVIQEFLPTLPDKEFKAQAFSFAFAFENSVMMLLRIQMMAKQEKVDLILPRTCLNLDVSFTEEQTAAVKEEMDKDKNEEEEQDDAVTEFPWLQAHKNLENIISRNACSASIELEENPFAQKEMTDLDEVFEKLNKQIEEKKTINKTLIA